MLLSLHVKNLALIQETEVEFGPGLNILTGETGAGKSVLIGSVNLALGARFEKEMLRRGAESALVELSFSCEDSKVDAFLQELDIPKEDVITITRKLQPGKSVSRINGETVNVRQVRELAELLIDIHGQHEHQSLLHRKKHLEILDLYAGEEIIQPLERTASLYREVNALRKQIEEEGLDEEAKAREQALLSFELEEIDNARLIPGEDEEAENTYRRMVNSKKITEALAEGCRYTGSDEENGAGNGTGRALRLLRAVSEYDARLGQLEEQLSQIDDLLSDYNREVSDYLSDMEFDDEDFARLETRLNEINRLKDKYGNTIDKILQAAQNRAKRLEQLADYDAYMSTLQRQLAQKEEELIKNCEKLSVIRKKNGKKLEKVLTESLMSLNFSGVAFEIAVREQQAVTGKGYDEVEFLISTNPGEDVKPLAQVASGGELSRIMLAIKTVLAKKDDIDTLIFDEIDAGISGRTAWKVSEQLDTVARAHQVICITHLAQIAAMADHHFIIEKNATDDSTVTDIRELPGEENLKELARLLGSDSLSQAAVTNAREMRRQAEEYKQEHKSSVPI